MMVPSKSRQRFKADRSRGLSCFQALLMLSTSCRWNRTRTSSLRVALWSAARIEGSQGEEADRAGLDGFVGEEFMAGDELIHGLPAVAVSGIGGACQQ